MESEYQKALLAIIRNLHGLADDVIKTNGKLVEGYADYVDGRLWLNAANAERSAALLKPSRVVNEYLFWTVNNPSDGLRAYACNSSLPFINKVTNGSRNAAMPMSWVERLVRSDDGDKRIGEFAKYSTSVPFLWKIHPFVALNMVILLAQLFTIGSGCKGPDDVFDECRMLIQTVNDNPLEDECRQECEQVAIATLNSHANKLLSLMSTNGIIKEGSQ